MLLFKKILETEATVVRPDDKRKLPRYAVGEGFQFKTTLTLFHGDGKGATGRKGKDWSVTTVNLSATGANVRLSLAAVAFPREKCCLKFSLGDYHLEIPGTIAHFRYGAQHSLCGIHFNFPDAETHLSYLQLLEPVFIGDSLLPFAAGGETRNGNTEHYGGNPLTTLTVNREAPGGAIIGFDLRMRHYMVGWVKGSPELEVYGLGEADPSSEPSTTPLLVALTPEEDEEVRWLFCLAVPNLTKAVPADVRAFLAALVA